MYVIVKWCCGVIAAFTTVGFLAASAVAAGHGIGISPNVTIVAVVTIGASTVLAGMAWIVEQANQRSAFVDINPAVAAAVECICAKVNKHLDEALEQNAQASRENIRTLLETSVRDTIKAGLGQAERYGMIREADGRIKFSSANGTVTSIRQREGE